MPLLDYRDSDRGRTSSPEAEKTYETLQTPIQIKKLKTNRVPIPYRSISIIAAAILVFLVLLFVPIFNSKDKKAQQCLALAIFLMMLWSTEAIPLWCTSLMCPFFVIVLQLVDENGFDTIADYVLRELGHPTVVLVLGGFTMAQALHKYELDLKFAVYILSCSGNSFAVFLLLLLFLNLFLSMWISNVISPALSAFLVQPMLLNVDNKTGKCVAMAIAYSCNIGGMLTPIASPQNEAAIGKLEDHNANVGFGDWILVTAPICLIFVIFLWIILLKWFNPSREPLQIKPTDNRRWGWEHYYVIGISLVTIALWCAFQKIKSVFGQLGTIGLIPVVFFYGAGILTKEDLGKLDWSIMLLIGGGEALGAAVKGSKLLDLAANEIDQGLAGQSTWAIYSIFLLCIIIITNFISHTVGALTMLGVVAEVGQKQGHCAMYVVGGVLCCSSACCLPFSSFPNIIAYSIKDKNGDPFLQVSDFIKLGLCMEVFQLSILLTFGYFMFNLVGW